MELMNRQINLLYKHKKDVLKKALEKENWQQYVYIHERPYRLEAFDEIMNDMAAKDYWDILSSIWQDSENISQNIHRWMDLWSSDLEEREAVMDEDERAALAALPETITIYRGIGHMGAEYGMSWTTSLDKAVWFAKRFSGYGDRAALLVTGKSHRDDVLAYLLGRNEHEIVIMPEDVEVLEIKRLLADKQK